MFTNISPRPLPSLRDVCSSSACRLRTSSAANQKRCITQNYLARTLEAKLEWAREAAEIKAGRKDSMLSILEKRGLVNQIVGDRDELDQLMTEKRVGAYVGIDPTASSMHVGHLLPLMVLYWMYLHGFHACSLLGGATARIGDPSGRTTTREAQHSSVRKTNMLVMHMQLKSIWAHVEQRAGHYGYRWQWAWRRELTNNNTWLNKLPAVELLKILGSGVRLGTMLGRDTVKNRIKSGDGMSFSEFTYPLLQSWDWWHMYSTKDIQVQIGGADQFGNILAGIDAINHIRHTHHDPVFRQDLAEKAAPPALHKKPMGFTVPLLTTASGAKFGKSEGNAIWLDRQKTSAFELYQFFLRTADADVHRYLKLFTFEPLEVLDQLMEEHGKAPAKRVAQHKLAEEVLKIVHGKLVAAEAKQEHSKIFQSSSHPQRNIRDTEAPIEDSGQKPPDMNRSVNRDGPVITAANAPTYSVTLPRSLVYKQPISRLLYHAGLVASRSEGHRLVAKKGAYLGAQSGGTSTMGDQVSWKTAENWDGEETEKYIIGDDRLMLRAGKWKVKVVKIIGDEEFEQRGLEAPGWKELKLQESSEG